MENSDKMNEITPFPYIEELQTLNSSNDLIKNENSYKVDKKEEEIKINLALINNSINIKIKYGNDIFNSLLSLKELQENNTFFNLFNSIEDVLNLLYNSFNENHYNIQKGKNNLILNIDILYENKKNKVSFILEKNDIKNEDKIKSLYILTYKFINENNELKEDINYLKNKVNSIENLLINFLKEKNEKKKEKFKNKERKKETSFDNIIQKSKIIENNKQINMLKDWLPFQNKNNLKCKLIYDSQIDGDNASTFHSLCKYKKGTLTVISTSDNKKIGAFISVPLKIRDYYCTHDKNSFLFSFNSNEKYKSLGSDSYENVYSGGPHIGLYGDNYNISIKDNYLS